MTSSSAFILPLSKRCQGFWAGIFLHPLYIMSLWYHISRCGCRSSVSSTIRYSFRRSIVLAHCQNDIRMRFCHAYESEMRHLRAGIPQLLNSVIYVYVQVPKHFDMFVYIIDPKYWCSIEYFQESQFPHNLFWAGSMVLPMERVFVHDTCYSPQLLLAPYLPTQISQISQPTC